MTVNEGAYLTHLAAFARGKGRRVSIDLTARLGALFTSASTVGVSLTPLLPQPLRLRSFPFLNAFSVRTNVTVRLNLKL